MLDGAFRQMLADAVSEYNDGTRFRLHFVTAREMANIVFAAIGEVGLAAPATSATNRYRPVTPPHATRWTTAAERSYSDLPGFQHGDLARHG